MGDLSTNPQPTAHAAATHTAKASVYPGGDLAVRLPTHTESSFHPMENYVR
jgi:hypothetical protein